PMPGDPYFAPPPQRPFATALTTPPGRLRIGFMTRAPRGIPLNAENRSAVEHTARVLEKLGHVLEENHPEDLDDGNAVAQYGNVVTANPAGALDAWGARVGREVKQGDVEVLTWALASRGRSASATDLLASMDFVHGFGRRLAAWWEGGFDLLLTAT